MTERILVIDGDIISFRCSAANEVRSITATHKVTGKVTNYAHRTAFRERIKGNSEVDEFVVQDVQTPEDISYAYHGINTSIEALCKSCKADRYEIYISGENNFRDSLELPTKYKSNRDGLRPIQLDDCKNYLVDRHGAVRVDGIEPDDKLAQRCYEGVKSGQWICQATLDKDAMSNEGYLYMWTKMTEPILVKGLGSIELDDKRVLRGIGRKWFYSQWVKGDKVDCFSPNELSGKKFGDVSCFKLLSDCKTDKECVEAVYKQYKVWYPSPVTYTAWDGVEHTKDVIEIMDMYAACSHMKRFETDVFDTRKLLQTLAIPH